MAQLRQSTGLHTILLGSNWMERIITISGNSKYGGLQGVRNFYTGPGTLDRLLF